MWRITGYMVRDILKDIAFIFKGQDAKEELFFWHPLSLEHSDNTSF